MIYGYLCKLTDNGITGKIEPCSKTDFEFGGNIPAQPVDGVVVVCGPLSLARQLHVAK